MADRKDCAHYADCPYRNDIGICPYWCMKYKHRDEVRVVRCMDCKHRGNTIVCPKTFRFWDSYTDEDGFADDYYYDEDNSTDDGFCEKGERKDNG